MAQLGAPRGRPDEALPLERLKVEGRASWLGDARWGPRIVEMSCRSAWTSPSGRDDDRREIPLGGLTVVAASTRSRSRRPRHASAPWVLTASDGSGEVTFTGPWLSLAWIGHLAGWPEPESTDS